MLARRREQILIIAGLLGLNILLGWSLGRFWKDHRSRTQWLYSGALAQPPATPAARLNLAGQPQSFVEIVDRSVFSPLRGVPPPQPQEEAKAPKLPLLFGSMNLGNGRFALMAPGDQPSSVSKRVLPGEEIGGYKLVSIGTSNVVLEWQEKKITLDISESARRAPGVAESTASGGARFAPGSTAGSPAPSARSVAPVSFAGPRPPPPQMAVPTAQPEVPAGTVVGGKRKVLVATPFGTFVDWQDVGPAGSQTPQQTGSPNK
ncbi:MAG: hypothetical protein WB763_03550 [Terriglobia bacterium]|jgi:hypothetical protein